MTRNIKPGDLTFHIGTACEALRLKNEMTQNEMADALGIEAHTYASLIRKDYAKPDTLNKVAKKLRMTIKIEYVSSLRPDLQRSKFKQNHNSKGKKRKKPDKPKVNNGFEGWKENTGL